MARGDFEYFDWFYTDEGLAKHNLNGATLKWGLVTNAVIPSRSTPDPRWGPGGTTNFQAQEVTPDGTYLPGGIDINSVFTKENGTSKHNCSVVSWAADPSNPQNAAYAILYNETSPGKECVAFADLGGVLDMRAGPLTLTPNAAGLGVKGKSAGPV